MSKIRNPILFLAAAAISAVLIVQYLRLLQPAQARAVQAACRGLQPSATNGALGNLTSATAALPFTLKDLSGRDVSLSDYRGKIVVVNFWASWCSVCRSEKPSLEAMRSEFASEDVVILAAASDPTWAPVKRALLGFEVSTAAEVLRRPQAHGIHQPEKFHASGEQVVISRVDRGKSAFSGGARRLDRIVSINGQVVESPEDLDRLLIESGPELQMLVQGADSQRNMQLRVESDLQILLDPPAEEGSNLGKVAKSYGITAVPESFVIDREGNIRHYFINKRNWDGDVAATCLQNLIDG